MTSSWLLVNAESGVQAVTLTEEFIPDVVLMDLIMPEMDGIEATRRVKNTSPRSQIMVLTSSHEDEHIFPAPPKLVRLPICSKISIWKN